MTTAPAPPAQPAGVSSPAAPVRPGATGRASPRASRSVSPDAAQLWRRWRIPLALAGLVLLAGFVVALLQPPVGVSTYLDPGRAGTEADGAHALADLLAARGDSVITADTPAAAEADMSGAGPGPVTLVVTSPALLTAGQLAALARSPADRFLVGPDRAALAALAPEVTLVGPAPVAVLQPGCDLAAARLAGPADLGGLRLAWQPGDAGAAPGGAASRGGRPPEPALCYPTGGSASLVRYTADGRVITVLGTGNPLTNGSLAEQGNAALALNLLPARARIVWLVPGLGLANGASAAGGQQSFTSLVPLPAYLVTIELAFAVLLAALWRVRRLGPLVPEPIPLAVRASETVEGQAALYRSRRARDRAAAALRTAMLARTLPVLGLAPDARPEEVISVVSARSGSDVTRVGAIVFGPAPRDDATLVALADDLDTLEREVRRQ
jgi:hypothetical protein